MKRILFVILSFISVSAVAQESIDDYMQYKIDKSQYDARYFDEDEFLSDTLRPRYVEHRRDDRFGDMTSYAFSFVRYARRGADYDDATVTLDGITLRSANIAVIRHLGLSETSFGGLTHGTQGVGGVAGVKEFSMIDVTPPSGRNVGIFFSGKGYLGGIRASLHDMLKRDWSLSAYISARGGHDLYVEGVYSDVVDAGFRLTKYFASGATLSMLCVATVSARGMRSGSTQEAFDLRSDNLYNPLWGRQDGRVRNSRVRRDVVPFVAASYIFQLGSSTSATLSAGTDYGLRRMSSLGWYDAMTPRPDNYRYMPSYFTDSAISSAVADVWRSGDERYTQINWDDMYRINSMSQDGGAVYALDDRVERIARGEVSLRMHSRILPNFTLSYGVKAWIDSSRNYKSMRDLLGAEYLLDLDYYLMDDDSFSGSLQNDKRNPNRRIVVGDRFSYDYALLERGVELGAHLEYSVARWRIDVDVALGSSVALRRGYYEKELFDGSRSFGRSAKVRFAPYTLKIASAYAFSEEHSVDVQAMLSARAPRISSMFLNPQYNNRLAENINMEQLAAVEINYRYKASDIGISATAYLSSRRNMREVSRMYDDLSGIYCDVDVAGIATLGYGVELAADYSISRHLRASAALAFGQSVYSKNPFVTHYSDTDNTLVSLRSESLMGDCYVGGTPQLVGMGELSYFSHKGWSVSCSVQAAALRYVDASFVRRTKRVLSQAVLSDELFVRFAEQHRLNDVVTVDASVSHWFRLRRGRLVATLAIKNILGRRDFVYSAYEPSRIRNYTSGERRVYLPQEDIVTYSYPRTLYAVVSWKF